MRLLHVAIIMDGNGRWARGRGHARFYGHVRGAQRVRETVEEACRLGLGALTLYAFSTENWKRPEEEKAVLWKLLRRYLKAEVPELKQKNVRFRVIGDREQLPLDLQQEICAAEEELAQGTGLQLSLAISYGSRDEILRAVKRFISDSRQGISSTETLDEKVFSKYLDTGVLGNLSNIDLVLRTSGEQRLSNFLLWQSAYAELIFLDKAWPEFRAKDLREALESFSRRQRRFGEVQEKPPLMVSSRSVSAEVIE